MEQNLKSYLESMKLKTTVFGGYDPEDVILKMTEGANLAHSEAHQQCQQLEQKLSAQEEKLRQTEVSLKETSERLRQAETEKQHTEVELAQLRAQLAAKSEVLRFHFHRYANAKAAPSSVAPVPAGCLMPVP